MTDLTDIAQRVVSWASDSEHVEVVAARGKDTEITVYGGDIESLSSAETQGVGIRIVLSDKREGFAYAASFDEEILRETFADARDNAGFSQPDEWNGVTEPDGVPEPEIDVFDPELASVAADAKVQMALDLEAAILAGDDRITKVVESSYADVMSESAIVTTTGISSELARTAADVSAYALAGEGDDTQTGFGFSVGRGVGSVDLGKASADCVMRTTRLLGATKPGSARLPVILDPYVAAQFLAVLSATLNGEAVLKGRSLFAERMGEDVGARGVTLVDDPTNPEAYTAGPRDAEGLASRRNVLIDGGVLKSFVHNGYTGRRSGTASTGNAVRSGFKSTPGVGCRALQLQPGTKSQEELIAEIGEGVLIQDVTGLHSGVNPVSGDFSTGADGLMIRDGKLAEPIREFTIASTIQKMLKGVIAVGNDVDWLPMNAAGVSVVIDDVTISGS
jgi:PmbA protein